MNQFVWKWIPSVGKSGGILGFFKSDRFDVEHYSFGRYHIRVQVMDKKLKKPYAIVIVYGAAQEEHKDEFLIELGAACADQQLPLLIGGDFNIIRFDADKNTRRRKSKRTDMFNAIIDTHELREIRMSGGQYTWSNNHEIPVLEKLDRVLVNDSWESIFPLMIVGKLVREMSDHNPLLIDIMETKEQRRKDFRYDTAWHKHPEFLTRMEKLWHEPVVASDSLGIIQEKLKKVKKSFKGWGHNIRGQIIKQKKDLEKELLDLEALEEIQPLTVSQLGRRREINTLLMEINEGEEEHWNRLAGENWLLKGDCNTKYFHRIANGRRRKNIIFSLVNGEKVIQGTPDLLHHATRFFKELFVMVQGFQCRLREEMWGPDEQLTEEETALLDLPFEEEEIRTIINSMEKNKAAGPNGFP